MALQNYPECERRVLAHEGSKYTDGIHPYDPGGPTRWGITITDARKYWKPDATPNDVRDMPVAVAEAIYKSKYWDALRCSDLPSGLDYTVFDYGVNSGIGRSGKVLRRVIGLSDSTYQVTDDVLKALSKRDVKQIIVAMNDERLRFLQSLKIWPTYKNGWTTRVNEVKAYSLQLADTPASASSTPITESDTGRGEVKPPDNTKSIIKTATGAGPLGAVAEFWDWVQTHPLETALIVAGVVAVSYLVISSINRAHTARQEAPTPGITPVPEKA